MVRNNVTHGEILEVVALQGHRLRAHIVNQHDHMHDPMNTRRAATTHAASEEHPGPQPAPVLAAEGSQIINSLVTAWANSLRNRDRA